MGVVGVIAEYNPFHRGHLWHLERAKELAGAERAAVILGGDFVQRGEPALLDKWARAEIALAMGADLVFELPARYSCASAERFALGAVLALDRLGFVDALCFGSESGDLSGLLSVADALSSETDEYRESLRHFLREGMTFPAARSMALAPSLGERAGLLRSPNDILAVEYLKALRRLESGIVPIALRREGGHSDASLSPFAGFPSSAAIRGALGEGRPLPDLRDAIPERAYALMEPLFGHTFPIFADDFSDLLYYKLRSSEAEELASYGDVTMDLALRMKRLLPSFDTFEGFAMALKTRQNTLARVRRCLLHVLLELPPFPKDDGGNLGQAGGDLSDTHGLAACADPDPDRDLPFLRLLGMRKDASRLLRRAPGSFPILTRVAPALRGRGALPPSARETLQKEVFCSDLYARAVFSKYGERLPSGFPRSPLIV